MAFREVAVIEVREVLRCWLAGQGLRTTGEWAGVDRKTARRYVEAAVAAGLHSVPHSGETTGPDTVWDAVRLLRAERIGHEGPVELGGSLEACRRPPQRDRLDPSGRCSARW